MLHEMMVSFARDYVYERGKPFAGNEFGNFVRHDIPNAAQNHLTFLPFDLKVKGSVGAGNWAAVPWLGFFDPLITTSAATGFYVVYFINAQTTDFYLSMNQGTTAVYSEFGESKGRDVLKRRAVDIAARIPEYAKSFDSDAIELGSEESLPAGYTAGHSFGRRYSLDSLEETRFYRDLEQMLYAYEALIDRGGTTPTDVMISEAGSGSIDEVRKYTLSKRIERSGNVRRQVLSKRAPICEGCGLDPELDYNYRVRQENMPLDVHHSKPLFGLAEGETRRYRIPNDFLVLCPTCHRMIHKQNDPSDLDLLRSNIRFKMQPKTSN